MYLFLKSVFLYPVMFRPKDDTLETDEFKNFFLRSLGEFTSSLHIKCLSELQSIFIVRTQTLFFNPLIENRILSMHTYTHTYTE